MHRWLARYEGEGLEGLGNRSSHDFSGPSSETDMFRPMFLKWFPLAVWVAMVVALLAVIFATSGSLLTPALSVLLGATISAGAALRGVRLTLERQDRRATGERIRTAYRQLIRAANRIIYVVQELALYPSGHPYGGTVPAVTVPAGYDPLAEAKALAAEAQQLVIEARITLSLELAGDEDVYDAYEAVEENYWAFIRARQEGDSLKADEQRTALNAGIERLITAARQHLSQLDK